MELTFRVSPWEIWGLAMCVWGLAVCVWQKRRQAEEEKAKESWGETKAKPSKSRSSESSLPWGEAQKKKRALNKGQP